MAMLCLASCSVSQKSSEKKIIDEERIYLQQVQTDFIQHQEDVNTIFKINSGIVKYIDSIFDGQKKNVADANLLNGIMNTRAYNLTILAYKNILNGNYIRDAELKLKIARYTAWFEGVALSKRGWDEQWDKTARPYLYNNGLMRSVVENKNLVNDPVIRSVLWDRRMFAHDTEIYTPRLLASADSVINYINTILHN